MKAIEISEPYQIRVIEKEMPVPAADEALLKVLYCGICGADVASHTGNQPFTTYPRIPGHEFSAQIVSVPENEKGLKAGDIITCNPYFNCGHCYACRRGLVNACHDNRTMGVQRDGSFQEYITMPTDRLIPGKGLSAKELALIEPFSIGCHALSRAPIQPTDKVLIMGAGPIGLFALLRARAMGVKTAVCDLLENRLQLARDFGADMTVNASSENLSEKSRVFTEGCGYDVCVEACGAPETFLSCIEQAAHGANIILIGNGKRETTFVHSVILKKELNIYGSRNAYTKDFEALIDIVSAGKADILHMVSAVYPAEDAAAAFEALSHNDGTLAKVLLRFSESEAVK